MVIIYFYAADHQADDDHGHEVPTSHLGTMKNMYTSQEVTTSLKANTTITTATVHSVYTSTIVVSIGAFTMICLMGLTVVVLSAFVCRLCRQTSTLMNLSTTSTQEQHQNNIISITTGLTTETAIVSTYETITDSEYIYENVESTDTSEFKDVNIGPHDPGSDIACSTNEGEVAIVLDSINNAYDGDQLQGLYSFPKELL